MPPLSPDRTLTPPATLLSPRGPPPSQFTLPPSPILNGARILLSSRTEASESQLAKSNERPYEQLSRLSHSSKQIRLLETRRRILSPASVPQARATDSPPAFTSSSASSRLQDLAYSLQRFSDRKEEQEAVKEVVKVELTEVEQWELDLKEKRVDWNYDEIGVGLSPTYTQWRSGR